MSDLRIACEHGRYDKHAWLVETDDRLVDNPCPGGRKVTDDEIREIAYQVWLKDQSRLIVQGLATDAAIGDTV